MSSIFDGLEKFGIKSKDKVELYKEDKVVKQQKVVHKKHEELTEKDYLIEKELRCPICERKFQLKTVRTSKLKRLESDKDLRPKFENIDVLKYDIILCPHCGFAILTMYLDRITSGQRRLIRENISSQFKATASMLEEKEVYSFDEAKERYQLALMNALVRRGKDSEKAYLCLKAGWLVRGQMEEMKKNPELWKEKGKSLIKEEEEFLRNAYDGFINAIQKESYPICGMSQDTLEFILANLAIRFKEYDTASKFIYRILTTSSSPRRIKDKALDLKTELVELMKKAKNKQENV